MMSVSLLLLLRSTETPDEVLIHGQLVAGLYLLLDNTSLRRISASQLPLNDNLKSRGTVIYVIPM